MSEQHRTTRRTRLWWWVGGGAALLVVALVIAGFVYTRGRGIWTDGMGLVISRDQARVRDVLWQEPEAMAEQFNTPGQEYEVCLSPDGTEMYFVRGLPGKGADLMVSKRHQGTWAAPEPVASVNTACDELGPKLSRDGRTLLFYSDRPGGHGGHDIWAAVRRGGGPWQAAVNLGPAVNGPHNEYGPALDAEGRRLFFSTNRKAAEAAGGSLRWKATIRQGQIGDYDLFVADLDAAPPLPAATRPADAATRPAETPLPFSPRPAVEVAGVNTSHHEGTPCVSPAGDFLYFASNRPAGSGGFDLYRVRITGADWPAPVNLGPQVNTDANETDPQLADGGFRMYFSSDRQGEDGNYDLYVTTSREVYSDRQGRGLPQLGWGVWVFLGALALLIPLLLFLKAGGYKHLSTIQKCAMVSLLVHVLLTLLFSLHEISRKIIEAAKDEPDMVVLNLNLSNRMQVVSEIRDQISDLPVADSQQATVEMSLAELPPLDAVSLPPAEMPHDRATPTSHMRNIVIPRRQEPIESDPLEMPQPTLIARAPVPEMNFTPRRVSQEEVRPKVAPVQLATVAARRAQQPVVTAGAEATGADTVAPLPPATGVAEMHDIPRPVGRPAAAELPPEATLVEMRIDPTTPMIPVSLVRDDRSEQAALPHVGPVVPIRRRVTTMPAARARAVASVAPPKPEAPARSIATNQPTVRAAAHADAEPVEPEVEIVELAVKLTGPAASRKPVRADAVRIGVPMDRPTDVPRRASAGPTRLQAGQITRSLPRTKATSRSNVTSLARARMPAKPAPREITIEMPSVPDGPTLSVHATVRRPSATDETAPPGSTVDGAKVAEIVRARAKPPADEAGQVVRLAVRTDRANNRMASLIGLRDAPRPARLAPRPDADVADLVPAARPEHIAPGVLASPDTLSHRSILLRPRLVKKMGGSDESEKAVERALRYLAGTQQTDGRWTSIMDKHTRRKRGRGQADIALTGLAVLCNLAGGYTPTKPSDYRRTVARGLDYLLDSQKSDGSLWEGGGRMYGHAIATLALAEAAAMTGNDKYRRAAFKGSEYIIRAQHRSGGGWRYSPGQPGDTSVVGWCVMALHSTERLGMKIPDKTRDGALRYLNRVGGGKTRVLAGYQNRGPTPAMSAEAGFSRMLLGQQLSDAQQEELGSYLLREGRQKEHYYCWYYTSMAMMQLGGSPWEKWNPKMRDHLIKLQCRGGSDNGSWPAKGKYAGHNGAGKIYTTSLAALTLEVYYRYLPMFGGRQGQIGKP